MNQILDGLLKMVSDWTGKFDGAFNIRENGGCAGRRSTEHIKIESKKDQPGLDIRILPGTKGESVSIPACVTHGGVDDLTYNDFYVGENADVTIVAGCGVHTETGEPARHNGIHRFFLEKGARVKYLEKHVGTGKGAGIRRIDPVTEVFMAEDSVMIMETSQIGGVDSTTRVTRATLAANAKLHIHERLLTEGAQEARTEFEVVMNGDGAGTDLISRSVARGDSKQSYRSVITGNAACTGHSECDAIIGENGSVAAAPELVANHADAALIHEAAIGKIAGEQLIKLMTLGLTEQQAEEQIVNGFLE